MEVDGVESHKAGFPRRPYSLEISSGLPHSHRLDDEIRYLEATAKTSSNDSEESSPRGTCNQCPGTLNSEFGVTIRSVGLGCLGEDDFSGR
jgi:hypothetical protein